MNLSNHSQEIIIFLHYYLPGYESGGPLRSISNLVESLGDEYKFRIVTCNHDLIKKEPFQNIQFDCWVNVGKADVWYVSGNLFGQFKLIRELQKSCKSILYLNSLFDPLFSILPLVAHKVGLFKFDKVIIAPRGELANGALQFKGIKKWLFLRLAFFLNLHQNILWHASAEMEKNDIKGNFSGVTAANIHIASDLPLWPGKLSNTYRSGNLVFLSRITRMKNLDFALKALKKCREPVTLNIYGTIEDEKYWKECIDLIDKMPNHVKVNYQRAVLPCDVFDVLSRHGLFFLPTHGENYGHVIAESLASGTPVLISDLTPWGDLAKHRAGWVLPLDDIDAYTMTIERWLKMTVLEHEEMSSSARDYASKRLYTVELLDANRNLFSIDI